MAQGGFTDKTMAQNGFTKDSVKTGKWMEFIDENEQVTTDTSEEAYYSLIEYKNGNPVGIAREYYKSGKLRSETPYGADGHIDGIAKSYFESGVVSLMTPYVYGKKEGVERTYYESGKIASETKYDNGLPEIQKRFNEDGTEIIDK
jgi:antitoxin component YwqK of YwqJK toxin-antitoxin module